MSKKGIEDMIKEIEIFVDSCKFQPLSSTKIVVPKEDLVSMLSELRMKMPAEIERCQKIMRNKEAILSDARSQAEQIMQDASSEASHLVAQSDIVQLATAKADEITSQARALAQETIDGANQDAEAIRIGAMSYTQEALVKAEQMLHQILVDETNKYNDLLDLFEQHLSEIGSNRQEIEATLLSMQTPANGYDDATVQNPDTDGNYDNRYQHEQEENYQPE